MSIHMTDIQSKIFQSQKLKILQVQFCVQRLSRYFAYDVYDVYDGPFFTIIRAVMGETKNFLRNQLRINSDINDVKFEMCWINIKWSVVQKRILKLNICVDPNLITCPN